MLKKKIKCTTGSIRSTVPKDLTGSIRPTVPKDLRGSISSTVPKDLRGSIRPNSLTGLTGPSEKFGSIVGSTGINQCDLFLV